MKGMERHRGWFGAAILAATVAAGFLIFHYVLSGAGGAGREGGGTARGPAGIPPIDRAIHGNTETAAFAMGCFWGVESRFGSVSGVLRTRVGYSGNTPWNPSYGGRGDHIESVEVEFDPAIVSYESLLGVFWSGHDPGAIPWKRQYLSAIFPRTEGQAKAAARSKEREAAGRKGRIFTEILPGYSFHPAEAHHQKFALRGKVALLKEYQAIYPDYRDFMASTAVSRANGYAGGHGTCERFLADAEGLGLSPSGRRVLEEIVCWLRKMKPGPSAPCLAS